jgi:hypothetical protein
MRGDQYGDCRYQPANDKRGHDQKPILEEKFLKIYFAKLANREGSLQTEELK